MKSSRLWIHFLVLSTVPYLLGQSAGTGALTGTVTDASGAILVDATVTLTNTATNQTRAGTTSAEGAYRFSLLEPGVYRALLVRSRRVPQPKCGAFLLNRWILGHMLGHLVRRRR